MVDAVTTNVSQDGNKNYVAVFTNVCDGTGEAAVKKVDISALGNGPDSDNKAAYFAIDRIEWSIQGFTEVEILWDATSPVRAAILSPGEGFLDFSKAPLVDPKASGTTGDIKFTTVGNTAADTYTITLFLKKRQ